TVGHLQRFAKKTLYRDQCAKLKWGSKLFNQQFGGRGIGRFTEPRRSRRAAPSREGKLKE
ncbi:TPA: hypothetical protein ACLBHL_002018, partial [Neisseria meningitidis]